MLRGVCLFACIYVRMTTNVAGGASGVDTGAVPRAATEHAEGSKQRQRRLVEAFYDFGCVVKDSAPPAGQAQLTCTFNMSNSEDVPGGDSPRMMPCWVMIMATARGAVAGRVPTSAHARATQPRALEDAMRCMHQQSGPACIRK